MTTTPDLLGDALSYAGRDWPVIPLHGIIDGRCTCGDGDCGRKSGKHPRTKRGLHDATTDEATIREWFRCWSNSNIGIRTGSESAFVVLDVDPHHGGDNALEGLEDEHGPLPETVEAITGGGGRHILFLHPGGHIPCSTAKLGPGLDIRGDGGYIVVEPSVHVTGHRYSWELSHHPDKIEIAAAPDWLLNLVVGNNVRPDDISGDDDAFRFDPSGAQEVTIARAALKALNLARADDYDTWVKVGMILRSIDPGPAMLEIWDQWSRPSEKWRPGACVEKWSTFDPNGGLNLPTLLRWAREDSNGQFKIDPKSTAPSSVKARRSLTLPAYEPFPVQALPEPVRGFVESAAQALGCDPGFIALPAMVALAAAIGNTRRIKLKESWVEPSVIWGVIVAVSGSLKSPAIDLAVDPIRRLQREALDRYNEELQQYEIVRTKYDAELAAWKKGKREGDPPDAPIAPVPERCVVSDTTTEALAEILEGSPRGLLLARDEIAGWLRGFDQYKAGRGADCQAFLEMHRAGHLIVDRKSGSKKTIQVDRAAVSITGGIQPRTLRQALRPEFFENGLVARLLLYMPPRKTKTWPVKDIDQRVAGQYDALFDGMLAYQFETEPDGSKVPVDLPLTPEAQQVFIDFYNDLAYQQAEAPENLAAALAKIEGYAARIALIINLVRDEAGDPDLVSTEAIDAASMKAGVTLARWFAREAERVYLALSESDKDGERRLLVEMIERRGGRITPTDLRRYNHQFRDRTDLARQALQDLVDHGYGEWHERHPSPKGGRPTREFVLFPTENPRSDIHQQGLSRVDATGTSTESDTEEVVI